MPMPMVQSREPHHHHPEVPSTKRAGQHQHPCDVFLPNETTMSDEEFLQSLTSPLPPPTSSPPPTPPLTSSADNIHVQALYGKECHDSNNIKNIKNNTLTKVPTQENEIATSPSSSPPERRIWSSFFYIPLPIVIGLTILITGGVMYWFYRSRIRGLEKRVEDLQTQMINYRASLYPPPSPALQQPPHAASPYHHAQHHQQGSDCMMGRDGLSSTSPVATMTTPGHNLATSASSLNGNVSSPPTVTTTETTTHPPLLSPSEMDKFLERELAELSTSSPVPEENADEVSSTTTGMNDNNTPRE